MIPMKKHVLFPASALCVLLSGLSGAQQLSQASIPAVVLRALRGRYPEAGKVTWEKEKGNYEANWGGKSGEDHSVQFTPAGAFIEAVHAIPPDELPQSVRSYVRAHYRGIKITEAGKVRDAQGKLSYEAEVHGKDLIFDAQGRFLKKED